MTDELQLLREFGADLDPPGDRVPADLRRRVLTGALARRRNRFAWRLGAVGTAVAAIAATALVLHGPASAPVPHTAHPNLSAAPGNDDAGAVLRLAAGTSARRPKVTIRPDQYVFTEELVVRREYVLGGPRHAVVRSYLVAPELTQTWRSVDGSRAGMSRTRPVAGGSWRTTAVPGCAHGPSTSCAPGPAHRDYLPTDPDAMLAYLYAPARPDEPFEIIGSPDQRAFLRVPMVLESAALLPDVQAALFEAAARIPGVRVGRPAALPPSAGGAARSAVAVTRSQGGYRADLLFDAASYEYVGKSESSTRANRLDRTQAGDVLGRTVLLRSALVDRSGQLP